MPQIAYKWKRFFAQRHEALYLDYRGYLRNPESGDGKLMNARVLPFEKLSDIACLVIVGEPSTGKTTALKAERAREEARIKEEGAESIWLDVLEFETITALRDAIAQTSVWANPNKLAYLFIDNLDECSAGVEKLTNVLFPFLFKRRPEQLRLRLVCRTAEWRSEFERRLTEIWPQTQVYEIAPLRRIDIETAAIAHGLDARETLTKISEREATAFAMQPITLRAMLSWLATKKALPETKHDLYEELCRQLCREPREAPYNRNISETTRVAIAERIAASLLFGGKTAIDFKNDPGDISEGTLAWSDLVGDQESMEGSTAFSVKEDALLDALKSGLFNARGVDRIGFASKSYADFLAARYLHRHRMSWSQVRALFTHPRFTRVIPALHGVAAWYATLNSECFDYVLQNDPHVLLDTDPTVLDPLRKQNLVEMILKRYDSSMHQDRDLLRRYPFEKLRYDGIDGLLRHFILGKKSRPITRRRAIEIAAACKTTLVCDALITVLEDCTEEIALRASAAHAIGKIGDEATRMHLKPFAFGKEEADRNDELKGEALEGLWPDLLSVKELLAAAELPRIPNRTGTYQLFFYYQVASKAYNSQMVSLLEWTCSQPRRSFHRGYLAGLMDSIFENAWVRLTEGQILNAYTQAVLERVRRHDVPLVKRTTRDDYWFRDRDKRLLVLSELFPLIDGEEGDAFRFGELLALTDIDWLVGRIDEHGDSRLLSKIALILKRKLLSPSVELCTAIENATANCPELVASLQQELGAARAMTANMASVSAKVARVEQLQRSAGGIVESATTQRISDFLDLFDRGDLQVYYRIQQTLSIDSRGKQLAVDLISDLHQFPSWELLDSPTQQRVVRASARFLGERSCQTENARSNGGVSEEAQAGFRAFMLLQSDDPEAFNALSPLVWQNWANAIATFPVNLDNANESNLLATAYRFAPDDLLHEINELCLAEDKRSKNVFTHRKLEALWDARVASSVLSLLKRVVHPESFQNILAMLLAHECSPAWDFAISIIQKRLSKDPDKRALVRVACICLVESSLARAWAPIYVLLTKRPSFGRKILLAAIGEPAERARPIIDSLPEENCIRLVNWLGTQIAKQKRCESSASRRRGKKTLERIHTAVLQQLAARGTEEAFECLCSLERDSSAPHSLRWAVLEAEYQLVSARWHRIPPAELRQLARDASKRLVTDESMLRDVLIESIKRFEANLNGKYFLTRFLWDKQLGSGNFIPVEENTFSDFLRTHLETDLAERGVVLNREVQLRPSIAKNTGQRTDIHVDAVPVKKDQETTQPITVVIEAKGAWNKELLTAMETQLYSKYLRDTGITHGIYLVAWFHSAIWDSDDKRKQQMPKASKTSIEQELRIQAQALSQRGIDIVPIVLNITLPGTPSKAVPTAPAPSKASKVTRKKASSAK